MNMTSKKYDSVLAMVKDLSDPDFAKEFEKKLKQETIYIYLNVEDLDLQVFSSLKLAKKWADNTHNNLHWKADSHKGVWESESSLIYRKKIIRA